MGTPELAAHCLKGILDAGFPVAGVVTAPDRPAGRGRKLSQSPVKQLALAHGLPLLQPENLKSPEFVEGLRQLKAELQVVVAFRMLPEVVWSMPPLGTFNLHASLLPDYRGAAPINWVLINGETRTGVTTFLLDQQIDTGSILMQREIPIDPQETAGSLLEKVKEAGMPIILDTIRMLASGDARPVSQSEMLPEGRELHKAPKIYREDCRIDWNRPSHQVVNLIRGLNPQPGAFCEYETASGETLSIKLFEATAHPGPVPGPPGHLVTDNRSDLAFAAGDGLVQVHMLQMPGKKPMKTDELLRGYKF